MTTVDDLSGYGQGRAERSVAKPGKNVAADSQRQKRVESVQRLNASHAAAIDAIKNSTTRQSRKNVLSYGTLKTPNGSALTRADPIKPKTTSEPKHDSSTPLRDAPTCKPRPDPRGGMGNSRVFVPWCEKRKH
nr:MAG: hypothetical protein [Microvirus sp.]